MIDTTTNVSGKTHRCIQDAQKILLDRYMLKMRMQDILSHVIKDPEEIVKIVISGINNSNK